MGCSILGLSVIVGALVFNLLQDFDIYVRNEGVPLYVQGMADPDYGCDLSCFITATP